MAVVVEFKKRVGELKPLLARVDGVVGVALGGTPEHPRVVVMLSKDDERTRRTIAQITGDLPREVIVTGEFKARQTMTHH